MAKPLILEKILFSQGFGTRRYCRDLVYAELVKVNGELVDNPNAVIPTENLNLEVDGDLWQYHEKAYVVFNKPHGYECSHKTTHHPSVYGLLPQPLIERGIQCVGRLDFDTTDLLLMSDDGQFIHQMTSPKKNIGKIYRVTTASVITEAQISHLLKGVVLDDDPEPCLAKACTRINENEFLMTIVEGRYHQVKRMVAAVGNHVEGLHRTQIGAFHLPEDLPAGEWRWLSATDLTLLTTKMD